MPTMEQEVAGRLERVLDEAVRPWLTRHAGDIDAVDLRDGVLRVRLLGPCAGCPTADLEVSEFISEAICARVPEVRAVALVSGVSDALLAQGRALLAGHAGRSPRTATV